MWHRFLIFIGWRNEFDWAPPCLGPEVNHPYCKHVALRCCEHCGGGRYHAIHSEPYDPRRAAEVLGTAPEWTPGQGFIARSHMGSHPLTESTCDHQSCWCHDAKPTRVPRPSFVEREH